MQNPVIFLVKFFLHTILYYYNWCRKRQSLYMGTTTQFI